LADVGLYKTPIFNKSPRVPYSAPCTGFCNLNREVYIETNSLIAATDEPTSGLDSRAAQHVITGIQNIVSTGRSVICTIYQPSRRLFLAFDNLLLLKRGGEVVFFEELGHESKNLLVSKNGFV
jgi:ABC-type sugar transport system ATPase subunit